MNPLFFFAAAIGLAFGSFGNVLVYRIRKGRSFFGRSACPHCRKMLRWYDLFPVLSFFVLAGRCRFCRGRISAQYPAVELLSAGVFLFAVYIEMGNPLAGFLLGFAFYFLLLACVYDALYQELPDIFTVLIVLFAIPLHFVRGDDFLTSLIGAVIAFSWFGVQWLISRKAVGTGDIFLGGALGFLLGYPLAIVMLLLSYIVGAFVVLLLMALGKISLKKSKKICFGPFLGAAAVLTLTGVGEAYLSLF